MSVPAPRDMICFVCVFEVESVCERKVPIIVSRPVVRTYVPATSHQQV